MAPVPLFVLALLALALLAGLALLLLLLAVRARRGRRAAERAPPPGRVPERWIAAHFQCAAGSRAYKLYLPSGLGSRKASLVVMLHGCTQGADDFAAGTAMNRLADQDGFLVLYPEQSRRANPNRCWNWYRPEHQARDHGEPAILVAMVREIVASHPVDPARVFVAGVSAGGAMALVLAATYPDVFAAAGVHSGVAYGTGRSLLGGVLAMRGRGADPLRPIDALAAPARLVPIIVFHGQDDRVTRVANVHQIAEQWARLAALSGEAALAEAVDRGRAPDGRGYTRSVWRRASGRPLIETVVVDQLGHAWSGGDPSGTYTDPLGPQASAEMVRFFSQHARA